MTRPTHAAYLRSAVWRRLRVTALERANGRCEQCHRSEKNVGRLVVHHLTYARHGGAERPEDLLAVCAACHRWLHANRPPGLPPRMPSVKRTPKARQ